MMEIEIKIDEAAIRDLIMSYLESMLGNLSISVKDIEIQVKSNQNYKAEWETAAFRARYKSFK